MLDNHEPNTIAFTSDDYTDTSVWMPVLAALGVPLEITPHCPDDWAAGDIGSFDEPGASGAGWFWRVSAKAIQVTMADGRTFPVRSVAELATFLDRRNRLPGEPTD